MGGLSRQAVRLLVLLGFVGGSVLVAAPAQAAPSYVALGDSYSSGVGTRSTTTTALAASARRTRTRSSTRPVSAPR